MTPAGTLTPIAYKLTDKLTPLSTATLTLPHDRQNVPLRSFMELFTADGSAGVFRVVNRRKQGESTVDLTLQHGLCTLSDAMHPGESEETGSCRTLLTKLLSNQTRWTLGTVDVPDDQELTWEINNTNDLQGLSTIMKELPGYYLDFTMGALPWVLHVRKKPDAVSCEARIDRNLVDVEIEEDVSDMCTVAYAEGLDEPIRADSISEWGEITRSISVDEDLGTDVITETVQRYLNQHKQPRVTITLTAVQLSRLTGEPFDRFRKGMLCRCILDDMTVVQRIENIDHPDPLGAPDDMVLTLASTQNDLSVTVAGLVVDIRHVNQLYQKVEKNLKVEAQTIDMLAEEIRLLATREELDIVSSRISTAEIQLNETIGQLALKVDYNDYVSAINEVSLLLDAVNGTLEAKADLILLEALEVQVAGLLKVEELQAAIADLSDVSVSSLSVGGTAHCTNLEVWGQASCYGLTIYGETAATQEWVNEQGYLTSVPSSYALRSWVIETFATNSSVSTSMSSLYDLCFDLSSRVSALESKGS